MKTVVVGASPNPARHSHRVTLMLLQNGYQAVPLGIKEGVIGGSRILNLYSQPGIEDVHTVTLYLNARNQQPWYGYILALKPRRIIFNPGAENPFFRQMAEEKGILTEDACTLVMLSVNNY